jgi:hypothetical protein
MLLLVFGSMTITAQSPPHPNGGNGISEGTPVGGGAPVDGGLSLLLLMGSVYAFKKAYKLKQSK